MSTHMIETFYEDERGHEQTVRVHFEATKGQPQTLENPASDPEIEIYKFEKQIITNGKYHFVEFDNESEEQLDAWEQKCWGHLAEITESEDENA